MPKLSQIQIENSTNIPNLTLSKEKADAFLIKKKLLDGQYK